MANTSSNDLVDSELAARFSLGVIELFQAEQSFPQVQDAAKNAYYWADYCCDLLEKATPVPQPPVCKSGCDFCCYNQVELSTLEALLLGNFLVARFSQESLQLLLERVKTSLARRAGKTKVQLAAMRNELPCPLLEDGHCSIYEVRPLMCRAMHSLEVDACRQEFVHPNLNLVKFYSHRHIIHISISQGLIDACLALGYQSGPVDLSQAISDYCSIPNAIAHWLAGEGIFHTSLVSA
jgi:Fe-S-cluster containining protein